MSGIEREVLPQGQFHLSYPVHRFVSTRLDLEPHWLSLGQVQIDIRNAVFGGRCQHAGGRTDFLDSVTRDEVTFCLRNDVITSSTDLISRFHER